MPGRQPCFSTVLRARQTRSNPQHQKRGRRGNATGQTDARRTSRAPPQPFRETSTSPDFPSSKHLSFKSVNLKPRPHSLSHARGEAGGPRPAARPPSRPRFLARTSSAGRAEASGAAGPGAKRRVLAAHPLPTPAPRSSHHPRASGCAGAPGARPRRGRPRPPTSPRRGAGRDPEDPGQSSPPPRRLLPARAGSPIKGLGGPRARGPGRAGNRAPRGPLGAGTAGTHS